MATITRDLADIICGINITKSEILSHRRYLRLSKEEKLDFDKYKDKYSYREWRGAFIIMKYYNIPFHHRMFRQVQKLYNIPSLEFMERYRTNVTQDKPIPYIKPKYLIKELEFQGFVPLQDYKLKYGYNYIYSVVEGKFYIFPKRLVYGGKHKVSDKHPYLLKECSRWGIPGYGSYTQDDTQVKILFINQKSYRH